MESFFASLKREQVHLTRFRTRAEARAQLPVTQAGELGRAVSVGRDRGGDKCLPDSGPAAAEGDRASRSPTHTQVVGFEIICSF